MGAGGCFVVALRLAVKVYGRLNCTACEPDIQPVPG